MLLKMDLASFEYLKKKKNFIAFGICIFSIFSFVMNDQQCVVFLLMILCTAAIKTYLAEPRLKCTVYNIKIINH